MIRHYSFWALQWRKIVHSTKKIQSFIALFSPCAICVKAFIAYRALNSETSVILLDCHKTKFNKKKSNLIIRSKACRVQNFFSSFLQYLIIFIFFFKFFGSSVIAVKTHIYLGILQRGKRIVLFIHYKTKKIPTHFLEISPILLSLYLALYICT